MGNPLRPVICKRPGRRPSSFVTAFFHLCFHLPFIDFFANFYKVLHQQEKRMTGFFPAPDYDRATGKSLRLQSRKKDLRLSSAEPLT